MPMTGSGRLTLDLDGAVPQRYRTDLSMTLAAAGVRGDLVTPANRAASDCLPPIATQVRRMHSATESVRPIRVPPPLGAGIHRCLP